MPGATAELHPVYNVKADCLRIDTSLVPIHKRSIFPISASPKGACPLKGLLLVVVRRLLKYSHICICCAFRNRCALTLKKYPRLWTGTSLDFCH